METQGSPKEALPPPEAHAPSAEAGRKRVVRFNAWFSEDCTTCKSFVTGSKQLHKNAQTTEEQERIVKTILSSFSFRDVNRGIYTDEQAERRIKADLMKPDSPDEKLAPSPKLATEDVPRCTTEPPAKRERRTATLSAPNGNLPQKRNRTPAAEKCQSLPSQEQASTKKSKQQLPKRQEPNRHAPPLPEPTAKPSLHPLKDPQPLPLPPQNSSIDWSHFDEATRVLRVDFFRICEDQILHNKEHFAKLMQQHDVTLVSKGLVNHQRVPQTF